MAKKGISAKPTAKEAGAKPAKAEVPNPRAKSSGHRKKTADKWNQ